MTALIYTRTFM